MGEITIRAAMPAPVEDVWAALTDAAALRAWFCEHAEVELPHRFAFWGRYTPGGDAPAQSPSRVDGHTLRFDWRFTGVDNPVELAVSEDNGETVLAVTHGYTEGQDGIAGYPIGLVPITFWSLAASNLVDHLLGRPPTPRCDFTAADLRAELVVAATPRQVFDSVVRPEEFRLWFGLDLEIDPRPGGTWRIGGGGPVGTVLAYEPGKSLRLLEDSGTVTWTFAEHVDGTALTVTMSEVGAKPPFGVGPPYPGWAGWLSGIGQLRRYHDLGARELIWR